MKKIASFCIALILTCTAHAQIKILFDATKAESAGNADWIIDADLNNIGYFSSNNGVPTTGGTESNAQTTPTPSVTLGQTYAETYWDGGLSYWGLDCIKKGYAVESLPIGKSITYGNPSNTQDLSNYDVFVICEPNILFTAAEKTAILNFVRNGGGLFMIADHDISDRNNDTYDSPAIWNDLMQNNSTGNTNPFGFLFNNPGNTAIDNISETSTNLNPSLAGNDSILHGSWGNVTRVKWSGGTTMTLSPTDNPTVKPVIYATAAGSPASGNNLVLVAYGRYGSGKFVAFGDSSPFDDGTGDPNDFLYTGYMVDVAPNHRNIIMNSTIWLATSNTLLPINIESFSANQQYGQVQLNWRISNENNVMGYRVQRSNDGLHFDDISPLIPAYNNAVQQSYFYADPMKATPENTLYYRIQLVDNNGKIKYSEIRAIQPFLSETYYLLQNPISNQATVQVQQNNSGFIHYNLYNPFGQCLQSKAVVIAKGKQSFTIDTHELPSGTYWLQLSNRSHSTTIQMNKID